MPLYIDRHELQGLTAADVAEGHRQDLKVQHKYSCRTLTYWFDEVRGTAFCLIEAPEKEAVIRMHNEAHGLIPVNVIEVSDHLVENFLGRIRNPDGAISESLPDTGSPALRIIVSVELKDAPLLRALPVDSAGYEGLKNTGKFIKMTAEEFGGILVPDPGESILISFPLPGNALACAMKIIQHGEATGNRVKKGIAAAVSLDAGEPVTRKTEFFGETIRFVKRMCFISKEGQVLLSSAARHYFNPGLPPQNTPRLRSLNPEEESFLNHLMELVEQDWDHEEFNVTRLISVAGMSKSMLYRKLMALTNYSPHAFIREYRLKKAIEYLENQEGNIAQVAFSTGFGNPAYFSKCFKNRYGILPSEFMKEVA